MNKIDMSIFGMAGEGMSFYSKKKQMDALLNPATSIFFGRKQKARTVRPDVKQYRKPCGNENTIIFGCSGSGKVHHPWDNLKPCDCGERPLLMYDKEKLYYCGGETNSVIATCPNCGKTTGMSDIRSVIDEWNNENDLREKGAFMMNHFEKKSKIIEDVARGGRVVVIDPDNEYKELAKMLGGKVITINPSDSGVFNPFLIATEQAHTIEDLFSKP